MPEKTTPEDVSPFSKEDSVCEPDESNRNPVPSGTVNQSKLHFYKDVIVLRLIAVIIVMYTLAATLMCFYELLKGNSSATYQLRDWFLPLLTFSTGWLYGRNFHGKTETSI